MNDYLALLIVIAVVVLVWYIHRRLKMSDTVCPHCKSRTCNTCGSRH